MIRSSRLSWLTIACCDERALVCGLRDFSLAVEFCFIRLSVNSILPYVFTYGFGHKLRQLFMFAYACHAPDFSCGNIFHYRVSEKDFSWSTCQKLLIYSGLLLILIRQPDIYQSIA